MKKNAYIAAFCLMFGCILASARDNALEHAVGVNVRPSYIVPTHGFYNGYNPLGRPLRVGGSAHLNYSFSFSPESVLGISSRKHVSGSLSGGRYWCADISRT